MKNKNIRAIAANNRRVTQYQKYVLCVGVGKETHQTAISSACESTSLLQFSKDVQKFSSKILCKQLSCTKIKCKIVFLSFLSVLQNMMRKELRWRDSQKSVSFETLVKELGRNIISLLFLTKMLRFSEYSHRLVTDCLKAMILLQDNPLCA